MIQFDQLNSLAFDLQAIPLNAIALTEQDKAQASRWAEKGFGEAQQWQIYRNGLALLGVRQWLKTRGLEASPDEARSSLTESVTANFVNAAVPLQLGDVQVAICIQDPDIFDGLTFPQVLRYHPPLFAHLYLWVQLSEEGDWLSVESGLWHEDLVIAFEQMAIEPAWDAILPQPEALMDADAVLLGLRCAQAGLRSLALSSVPEMQTQRLTATVLDQRLDQWSELSMGVEVFTLQEGLEIMRSPQLTEQLTQTLQQRFHPSLWSNLLQTGINVGQWWSDTLDAAIEDLGWIRVSSLAPAMRSQNSTHTDLAALLHQQGVEIPDRAEVRYHDLTLGHQALRLFAMAWPLDAGRDELAWTLLLVLCAQPEQMMQETVQIDVRDVHQSLATEQLSPGAMDGCSFIQVSGELGEEFWVTLSLPHQPQMAMTLPPFFFDPSQDSSSSDLAV